MTATRVTTWHDLNQRYLTAAIDQVREAMQAFCTPAQGLRPPRSAATLEAIWHPASATMPPPALYALSQAIALTSFERDLLVLCAGVEMSAALAQLCASALGTPQLTYPTLSLALAALPEAHWSALTPARPLRYWRLIEVNSGESLTQSRLRIDERVLHFLNGVQYLDDRLSRFSQPLTRSAGLPPSHQQVVDQIAALWSREQAMSEVPVIQLCGEEIDGKGAIATAVCDALGLQLYSIRAVDLPTLAAEREWLVRLWERESILAPIALLVTDDPTEGSDTAATAQTLLPFLEAVQTPLMLATRDPVWVRHRPSLRLDVKKPTLREQRYLWQRGLASTAVNLERSLDPLVAQFDLSATTIETLCADFHQRQAAASAMAVPATDSMQTLWQTCRTQSRTRLEDLAQRIEAIAQWPDLVLPSDQRDILSEIVAQVRHRTTVYDQWGFAVRGANGLGISALFAGASGTGKTMAAEVLANALQLDLYRIDLSQVVSKYIGETEKNLRRVFDAAEAGGAILLFDEADALFGKRSDVKDSHDRYANIEVSYLLQRMETYRGLAILTTNFRSAIDVAFLRRIRFVVQFPFPDLSQRAEIWQRMFPPQMPTQGLKFDQLARLNITGGNIRNIALNAAFLAADTQEPVQMKHLLRAARTEYGKLEQTLTDAEVGGWIE